MQIQSHILVGLQLVAIAGCCYQVGQVNQGQPISLVISFIGFLIAIWTLFHNRPGNFGIYPELKPNSKLITTGPYEWMRHPMYSSLLIMMLGITLYNYHSYNFLSLLLLAWIVSRKVTIEEQHLEERFPEYQHYKCHTARYIPFCL